MSTKGQVVIPMELRRRLDLEAGDQIEARIDDGRLVLVPRRKASGRVRYKTSRKTGLPVCSPSQKQEVVTSDMVRNALADFP